MSDYPYDCGCDVVFCECGSMKCNAPWEIKYCPTHAAAFKLKEALESLMTLSERGDVEEYNADFDRAENILAETQGGTNEGKAEQDNRQTEQLPE